MTPKTYRLTLQNYHQATDNAGTLKLLKRLLEAGDMLYLTTTPPADFRGEYVATANHGLILRPIPDPYPTEGQPA